MRVSTEAYRDFLASQESYYITQDVAWQKLKGAGGWQSHCFLKKDNSGRGIIGLQMLSIEDRATRDKFFYIPRGPVCQLSDYQLARELVLEAAQFAKEQGAKRY